jgi:hypothetical protein
VRRVERGLDLAEAAISLVAARNPGVDLLALEAPPDKVIAETAIFLRSILALPISVVQSGHARADELARALLPHARHPRTALGIALHPALARDYAAAHLVLSDAGYPDAKFDQLLDTALDAPTALARERLPHREYEQAWLGSLAGGSRPPAELLARTALIRGTDLITGNRDDIYALTHSLLYSSDLGAHRPPIGSGDDVLAAARSALAGALDDDDFDLAGELLLTWPFLDAEWDFSASLAFAVLARVEDQVGILPSLAVDREGYEQQQPEVRKYYVAAATYHTAFVMGLLCSIMLRRQSYPCAEIPSISRAPFLAEALLTRLAADKRRPQWLEYIGTLSSPQLAACSSFLLDVALRRAVRRLDVAEVRSLLELAIDRGEPSSPLCAQAAQLLRRLALLPASMLLNPEDTRPA